MRGRVESLRLLEHDRFGGVDCWRGRGRFWRDGLDNGFSCGGGGSGCSSCGFGRNCSFLGSCSSGHICLRDSRRSILRGQLSRCRMLCRLRRGRGFGRSIPLGRGPRHYALHGGRSPWCRLGGIAHNHLTNLYVERPRESGRPNGCSPHRAVLGKEKSGYVSRLRSHGRSTWEIRYLIHDRIGASEVAAAADIVPALYYDDSITNRALT